MDNGPVKTVEHTVDRTIISTARRASTCHLGAAVLRFSVGQTDAIASIAVGELGSDGPLGMAAAMDSTWVGTPNIFTVSRIDPTTNNVIAEFGIPPGANPCGDIAIGSTTRRCRVADSSPRSAPSTQRQVKCRLFNSVGLGFLLQWSTTWRGGRCRWPAHSLRRSWCESITTPDR